MADEDRITEINTRFDNLLASLNAGLEESDRLKKETDHDLDELRQAVRELDEIAATPNGESTSSGRRRRERV